MINSGDVLCALSLSKGSACKITSHVPLSLSKGSGHIAGCYAR
jgi:hypothetical protein